MQFYVYLNGAKRGPFSEERVRAFLVDGLLEPDDLASDQPAGEWKPLSTFRRFAAAMPERAATSAIEVVPEAPPSLAASLGPYARATLAPDESPFYKTSLHWIIFVRFAALGCALILFGAIPLAIGVQALTGSEVAWFALPLPAFLLLPPALAFASSEIVITDRRVLIKTGVVRRQTAEMFISKVESISVDQGFFGRVFDFGTVRIRGTGGFEEGFDSIARPLLFRNWVQRLQSGERPDASEIAAPTPANSRPKN